MALNKPLALSSRILSVWNTQASETLLMAHWMFLICDTLITTLLPLSKRKWESGTDGFLGNCQKADRAKCLFASVAQHVKPALLNCNCWRLIAVVICCMYVSRPCVSLCWCVCVFMCSQGAAAYPENEDQQQRLREAAEGLRVATNAAAQNAIKKKLVNRLEVSHRSQRVLSYVLFDHHQNTTLLFVPLYRQRFFAKMFVPHFVIPVL